MRNRTLFCLPIEANRPHLIAVHAPNRHTGEPCARSLGNTSRNVHTDPMILSGLRLQTLMLCAALSFAGPAFGDQTDERLDGLFESLRTTGDAIEAAQITREIWQIWRETVDVDAEDLMDKGVKDMSLQRYTEALETFSELVVEAPDYAEGWNKRATLYYVIGDYTSSIEDIKRTLALEPRHFGAMSGLGLIYIQLDQEETALQAFQSALKMNPHLVGAQRNIDAIRKNLSGEEI